MYDQVNFLTSYQIKESSCKYEFSTLTIIGLQNYGKNCNYLVTKKQDKKILQILNVNSLCQS